MINSCFGRYVGVSWFVVASRASKFGSSALYLPRCRPDGEVVVNSRQLFIFPLNSLQVISAGNAFNSVAARHASSKAWHCGMLCIDSIWECPFKISLAVTVSAAQLMSLDSGISVKGVPCACPKWPRFRMRM